MSEPDKWIMQYYRLETGEIGIPGTVFSEDSDFVATANKARLGYFNLQLSPGSP